MSYESDITGDKTPFNRGVAMSYKSDITGDKTPFNKRRQENAK